MREAAEPPLKFNSATGFVLWLLIAIYAGSRLLQVFPGHIPMLAIVVLHVFPPALFALIHGAMFYRVRGILTFTALCLVIGTLFENLGIRTGFPFGNYYFTDVMGPKLLGVPVLLGLAYVGMGYLAWTLGRIILGGTGKAPAGVHLFTIPLFSAFIMVAWDLSLDPIWSTLVHAWIWRQGGAYFGVPVSNYLGWLLTVYVIYQVFALYLRNRPRLTIPVPSGYWQLAVIFYGISAAGNLLLAIPEPGQSVVLDPAGEAWKVSNITGACGLVSLFTMGFYALIAWAKIPSAAASRVPSLR